MNIKKILKLTFSVIIVVIIGFLIYDNYYVLTNKKRAAGKLDLRLLATRL